MNAFNLAITRQAFQTAIHCCEWLETLQPDQWEFWRRLAGTIRKGLTKI